MAAFGGVRGKLVTVSGAVNTFPRTASGYTAAGISVPPGALDAWWDYTPAASQAQRKAMVVFGDSTTWGSGGPYSWTQRLRDRAVSAGYANGGKGIFGTGEQEIVYDSPEVNGFVSSTFSGSANSWDTLAGGYFIDNPGTVGHQLVVQFRSTCLRLWYMQQNDAGTFTYSIDGAAAVTVNGNGSGPTPKFVFVTGLTANTTHTLTIVNTGGAVVRVAPDPVNDAGLAVQKQAISGGTIINHFMAAGLPPAPYTEASNGFRFQAAMGLTPTSITGPAYSGMTVDTTPTSTARVNPCLAVASLGFNDLSSQPTQVAAYSVEYVRRFAAACRAAGCSGLVLSGQLPYNSNWPTYGAAVFTAQRDTALEQGLAFADLFLPIGGPSLSYSGSSSNPHLSRAQYETQANWLWDNLLGL